MYDKKKTLLGYDIKENGNELFHYGIKGMKWGIRRYQNEDGTLTEAGKQRYRDNGIDPDKIVVGKNVGSFYNSIRNNKGKPSSLYEDALFQQDFYIKRLGKMKKSATNKPGSDFFITSNRGKDWIYSHDNRSRLTYLKIHDLADKERIAKEVFKNPKKGLDDSIIEYTINSNKRKK